MTNKRITPENTVKKHLIGLIDIDGQYDKNKMRVRIFLNVGAEIIQKFTTTFERFIEMMDNPDEGFILATSYVNDEKPVDNKRELMALFNKKDNIITFAYSDPGVSIVTADDIVEQIDVEVPSISQMLLNTIEMKSMFKQPLKSVNATAIMKAKK